MTGENIRDSYELHAASFAGRVRVEFNGVCIADSTRTLILHETRLAPAYYFPVEDVRMDCLARNDFSTHCPFKGNASYWSLRVADQVAENAVWSYLEPSTEAAATL